MQTTTLQRTSQTLYKLESWSHSPSDGASCALKSLTACESQLYPGYASGEKITEIVYDKKLTTPKSPK